jgi:hypothetical protein
MSQEEITKQDRVQPGWKVAMIIFGFLFGTVVLVLVFKWVFGV